MSLRFLVLIFPLLCTFFPTLAIVSSFRTESQPANVPTVSAPVSQSHPAPSLVAVHAAPPRSPLLGIDEKWRYFASPHFELYSRNGDNPSREVLYNLELLRAVFLERMKLEER